jgi:hypothetical protein
MKKNLRKMQTGSSMTIEAYAICYCACFYSCNICGSVPSSDYISQRDIRRDRMTSSALDSSKGAI